MEDAAEAITAPDRELILQKPVGAENRVTLCDLLVLVDESTETIAPKNVKTAAGFGD
jgi:hypothetical protein